MLRHEHAWGGWGAFLTSAFDGREWLSLRYCPQEKSPRKKWTVYLHHVELSCRQVVMSESSKGDDVASGGEM
jgi:hypothetical protein